VISQNIVAQGQAFNGFGFYDLNNITGEMQVMLGKGLRETMLIGEQRRNTRIMKNFQVTLQKRAPGHLDSLMKGNTLDLSQGGAFIKTEGWHFFESGELTEVTFFFPTYFTGKDTSSGLQGAAIVRRVDRSREGIAVEFIQELRQFRPITMC
jgi:hypothetical protein